jgi:hypothetical protein
MDDGCAGRLGDEGLRLMHLVPAPAVRLSCKDECDSRLNLD